MRAWQPVEARTPTFEKTVGLVNFASHPIIPGDGVQFGDLVLTNMAKFSNTTPEAIVRVNVRAKDMPIIVIAFWLWTPTVEHIKPLPPPVFFQLPVMAFKP
jgi:hypothetical protein